MQFADCFQISAFAPQFPAACVLRKLLSAWVPETDKLFIPFPGWRETLEPAWSKAWNDSSWKPFELGGNLLALAGGESVKIDSKKVF